MQGVLEEHEKKQYVLKLFTSASLSRPVPIPIGDVIGAPGKSFTTFILLT
jgi:hypothetical protein